VKGLFWFLLALFFCSGCTDEGVNVSPWDGTPLLDASINGTEMTTGIDSRFRLELDVWADAGYQWDCSFSDSTVLQLEKTTTRGTSTSNPPTPGGPTFETFYFKAKVEGSSTVTLIHRQRWMLTVPPKDSIGFVVNVRR
jgi:predicted secreted protein